MKRLIMCVLVGSWRHSSLQEIASILHMMAKKRCKICLLPELERRAEAISGEFNSQQLAKTRLFLILLFSLLTSNYVCDCDGSAKCGAHDTTGVPQTPIFIHHYHPLLTCVSSVTSSYISVLHEQLSHISRIFRLQKVEKLGIPPLPLLQVRTHVELSRTHMQLSRTHVELSAAASLSM
jgi:hypothetical protein